MSVEAAVNIKIKRIVHKFKNLNALSVKEAVSLDKLNFRLGFIFRRLIKEGVIIETSEKKYYLDEAQLVQFNLERRRRALIIMAITLFVMFLIILFNYLMKHP
jgi:hypothetical protein